MKSSEAHFGTWKLVHSIELESKLPDIEKSYSDEGYSIPKKVADVRLVKQKADLRRTDETTPNLVCFVKWKRT